ncbi:MAG: leucine-rich repeat domain-containing protein [Saprospiraceae bacterium]|nr:leucine-rich repeat domain-containing protein [Saprospiraceae bacterium]
METIIKAIKEILNRDLHPAPARGEDLLSGLMACKKVKGKPQFKYALDSKGHLIGLNLAEAGLTDNDWQKILAIKGFEPGLLQALNLSDNRLTDFPLAEKMAALEQLDVSENQIADLGFLGHLTVLTYFEFSSKPVKNPSPEIVAQGWQSVHRHFRRLIEAEEANKLDYLYEAKVLLVGRTGAGKTSLRYKLRGIDEQMPKDGESTRGIDVEPLEFEIEGGRTFRMNVWDFEGQQISYQTHQFFLTKRSLYVFVADQRTEKSDFEYWLQIVELLSDKSPLVIFQNERRPAGETKGQICALNLDGLHDRFGEFLCEGEYQANLDLLAKSERFDPVHVEAFSKFRDELKRRLLGLPHVGEPLPRSWVDVREKLEKMAEQEDHIPVQTFWDLCEENGIKGEQEQEDLDKLFHDLGIFLHFHSAGQPSLLSKMIILNNLWATKAVYQVLKSDFLREEKHGHFTLDDLKKVWAGTDHANHAEELLELMSKKHFEICYQVEDSHVYIAPQLLPPSPPNDYDFPDDEETLLLRYSYDFMPKGLITRLTVRMHPYIARGQTLAWIDGFVIERYGAVAEVTETYGKREIHIRATGEYRRKLINEVAYEMDRLNSGYKFPEQSPSHKLLPCCCTNCIGSSEPHFFKYQEVVIWKTSGWVQVPCGKEGGNPASVDRLLSILIEGDEMSLHDKQKVHAKLDALQHDQKKHLQETKKSNRKLENLTGLVERLSESGEKEYKSLVHEIAVTRDQFFQSNTEQKQFFEKISEEIKKLDPKDQKKLSGWQDGDIKHKLKITLPLLILRYEAEMDVSKFKIPKSWSELKSWFLNEGK